MNPLKDIYRYETADTFDIINVIKPDKLFAYNFQNNTVLIFHSNKS